MTTPFRYNELFAVQLMAKTMLIRSWNKNFINELYRFTSFPPFFPFPVPIFLPPIKFNGRKGKEKLRNNKGINWFSCYCLVIGVGIGCVVVRSTQWTWLFGWSYSDVLCVCALCKKVEKIKCSFPHNSAEISPLILICCIVFRDSHCHFTLNRNVFHGVNFVSTFETLSSEWKKFTANDSKLQNLWWKTPQTSDINEWQIFSFLPLKNSFVADCVRHLTNDNQVCKP